MKEIIWIKLHLEMYKHPKITHLQGLSEGGSLCYIWTQLLMISGQSNADGCLMVSPEIPYTPEGLAKTLNWPLKLMNRALKEFEVLEMIYIHKGVIVITNWEKYQNVKAMAETKAKNNLYKKNQRLREKLEKAS